MGIELNNDFEILNNESGGFTDYYHVFELKISKDDVDRLVNNIEGNSNEILIMHVEIESNIFKRVSIDPNRSVLIYEYIIN